MIQSLPDGWGIERNGRYYHLNQQWLEDMHRHQVKLGRKSEQAWNQLYYSFNTSTDPDLIYAKWEAFYDSTGTYEAPPPADPTPFQDFVREARENR